MSSVHAAMAKQLSFNQQSALRRTDRLLSARDFGS
jgi:hypothetical protein